MPRGCRFSVDRRGTRGAAGTSTCTIRGISTEVVLQPPKDPVPLVSVVNLDSIESVSVGTLVERLGRLRDDRMREICEALDIAVDCEG